MKTVYRSYTKNMAFTIIVMAFLVFPLVFAILGIFQMEEFEWGQIIYWTIYILVVNGYSIYLVARGGVKVDSETGIMTVVPGRQQIPIDRIQVMEIMTSKKGRIKRMNIRFYPPTSPPSMLRMPKASSPCSAR